LWAAGRHAEALRVTDECLATAPDFHRCRIDRNSALVETGRGAEASEEAQRLLRRAPALIANSFGLGFAPER
jgi:hypothetical protein